MTSFLCLLELYVVTFESQPLKEELKQLEQEIVVYDGTTPAETSHRLRSQILHIPHSSGPPQISPQMMVLSKRLPVLTFIRFIGGY